MIISFFIHTVPVHIKRIAMTYYVDMKGDKGSVKFDQSCDIQAHPKDEIRIHYISPKECEVHTSTELINKIRGLCSCSRKSKLRDKVLDLIQEMYTKEKDHS